MNNLKCKVCLVTGGAKGIGAEIVKEFLKEGVKHVAILGINETAGSALKQEAADKYDEEKIQFFKCDVINDEELFAAYQKTYERFGTIDVVVNSAGIVCDTPAMYKKEININFTATVASTLKAIELMRVDEGGKGGTVINISSIAALGLRSPHVFVYSGTKSAVLHFSHCIRSKMHNLKSKVCLVTGGANGIGAEIVREFLKEGVEHVAILDINETAGSALKQEAADKYGKEKIQFFKCDVTNDEELFAAYQNTFEKFGTIDVVVNSAGIVCDTPAMYKKEININFTATVASTLKAIELMRVDEGGKGGTVINISSIAALGLRSPHVFVYSGTKSAVLHFSHCIGMEGYYRHTNVRVLTICFGYTGTDIINDIECVDKLTTDILRTQVELAKESGVVQTTEAAAKGVVTAYVNGQSGSTWLVDLGEASDITQDIKDGFKIMSTKVFVD